MSPAPKHNQKGLGRGIDSLLPENFDKSLLLDETERVQKVDVNALIPNPDQPRKNFGQAELDQLALSIKQHGILQPLVVTKSKVPGQYIIMAGERRWRAAAQAGLKTVPVIIRSAREIQKLEIALVENVQRVNLSPLEQAVSIERLHNQFNLSYDDIAKRLGKGSTTIINIIRLLGLPKDARKALDDKLITEGHSRSILALRKWPSKQSELLKAIIRHGWSVRQAERFVVAYKKGAPDSRAAHAKVRTESPQTRRLSQHFEAPVTVRRMAHGGKLEIGFSSEEDLTRIIKQILK